MSTAKKIGSRGCRINGKAKTTDCCTLVEPSPFYYYAYPCFAMDAGAPCSIPDESEVWIGSETKLNDADGTLAEREAEFQAEIEAGSPLIVRIGPICYTLPSLWRHYAETEPDAGGFYILPEGAVKVGGAGITYDRRENCVDGCEDVNAGPECFEIFPCDGCDGDDEDLRRFVCAREVRGWTIVGWQSSGTGYCIDRSVGYSQNEADSIGLVIRDTILPVTIVAGTSAGPKVEPAESCCYVRPLAVCNSSLCDSICLRGRRWKQFLHGYAQIDVCCGTTEGLAYAVTLDWSRIDVYPIEPPLTVTETASVSSVTPVPCSGGVPSFDVVMSGIRRSMRQGETEYMEEFTATINIPAMCCVPYTGYVPMIDQMVENGQETPGGIKYYEKVPLSDLDEAEARRIGWTSTPWGVPFQLVYRDESDGTYSSSGNVFGDCNVWTFSHSEQMQFSNGRTMAASINFRLAITNGDSPACGLNGHCGPGGWSEPIRNLLP